MKSKKSIAIFLLGIFCLTQISCKKLSNSNDETSYDLSSKQAISDGLTEDINNLVLGAIDDKNYTFKNYNNATVDNGLPACATISVSGSFPNKLININFGSGCIDSFGIFRSGIIHILLSDSIRTYGSTVTVNFENYHVKKYKKEGTIIWTNQTPNNSINTRIWNRQIQNGKITDTTDGRYWLHSSMKTVNQYEGTLTPRTRIDDKYKIYNGSGNITNNSGTIMTTTILDTLFKSFSCAHIDKGTVKIERTNHYAVLDYGNGDCDNLATITIDGNTSLVRAITLP